MSGGPARPGPVVVVGERAVPDPEGLALLALVRALSARAEVRVVLFDDGPLVARLAEIAEVVVVSTLPRWTRAALAERLAFALGRREAGLARRSRRLGLHRLDRSAVVYLHEVRAVQALRYLPDGPTVLCRVAERAVPLDHVLNAADRALLVDRVDRFLAVTGAGARDLLAHQGAAEEQVLRFPEVVAVGEGPTVGEAEVAAARARAGMPPSAVVIGSFGVAAPEEPPDLVVTLARLLARRLPDATWDGLCVLPAAASPWVEHDVERSGLADRVHVVRRGADAAALAQASDVLVLMIRIDACPREYLDAAASGRPLVCFDTNELAELVGDGEGGFTVAYLDLSELADRVSELVTDPALRARLGAGAAARVAAVHGPEPVAERLLQQARELLGRTEDSR